MLRLSDPTARLAAVLHDVVEDTNVTLDDLRRGGFPDEVVRVVDLLTHREADDYDAYVERLAPDPIARAVKLADLLDNMDTSRLPVITAKTEQRLARYRRAYERLTRDEPAAGDPS